VVPVLAEAIEEAVNHWVGLGWTLEGIRFPGDGRTLVSFVRDRVKRIDLGEIDLGDAEPLHVELGEPVKKKRKKR
jgi:hypothetical protein